MSLLDLTKGYNFFIATSQFTPSVLFELANFIEKEYLYFFDYSNIYLKKFYTKTLKGIKHKKNIPFNLSSDISECLNSLSKKDIKAISIEEVKSYNKIIKDSFIDFFKNEKD